MKEKYGMGKVLAQYSGLTAFEYPLNSQEIILFTAVTDILGDLFNAMTGLNAGDFDKVTDWKNNAASELIKLASSVKLANAG